MATFFNELDMIYCLCIPSRKEFVTTQINKLGITTKVKIIDAYTPESSSVKDVIKNHLIYTIYTANPSVIACNLGIKKIMHDVVEHKYNYVLIMEDDVIFIENMFNHANKWITKKVISQYFNMEKPYVLHLQSNLPEKTFYNNNVSTEGIIRTPIRYGEPAYITNYYACELFLKHFYPITAPFDDYKHAIKQHYSIQQGILVPYICRELSGNYFGYDIRSTGYTFNRTLKNKQITIFSTLLKEKFYVNMTEKNGLDKMIQFLLKKMNPNVNWIFNSKEIPVDTMSYSIGQQETVLKNSYIIGGSINTNITNGNKPFFVISVRGVKSYDIIRKKYKLLPVVGDFLSMYNFYYPKKVNTIYKYCFIYETILNIDCSDKFIFVNPINSDVEKIVNAICNSQYVITNDISYITIANSYAVYGVYATLNEPIDKYFEIIAADYYSNFTKINVNPINIKSTNNNIVIDNNFGLEVSKFPQPTLPISNMIIKVLRNVLPFSFNYHTKFRVTGKYTQIIN
ncbi:putative orfan [Tupanvirus soda lake]|uniref:Orfan n=2 Tax=Tupanvirus TaxID=2094720 RepID=A0AC62ABJ9_9VIRU|nr:putative orfan [Tupanvirus soda lake]QKU35166.1 putative orfan [Tupanvirus soda lake]